MIIQKYGGSSVATVDKIRAVATAVGAVHTARTPVVVIVSARGDTTDRLLDAAAEVATAPSPRETDQLLAVGENASAAQLAMALHELGVPAVSLTGAQAGITAVGRHGAGVIEAIDTTRIRAHAANGDVVVVAGFQGVNGRGDVVTLGRGGSDTTAVAVAAALGASSCEICTDVDGVFTADPRIVAGARVLPTIDADVMAEMAFAGAQVLHSRAVELAAVGGVRIVVRSSFGRSPGTTILGRSSQQMIETTGFVTAIAHDHEVALVRVRQTSRPQPDLAVALLAELAGRRVSVDMVAWTGHADPGLVMGVAVHRGQLRAAQEALAELVGRFDCEIRLDEPVGKLSVVGTGLLNRPEHTARMLSALGSIGVAPIWVSTTQQRTSVLIAADRLVEAVGVLHRAFDLDRDGFESMTPA
ncbi:aspartate kinase [Saccharothrix deserti]|uniref:aspartate kinase n=1 Tax=Saccharothrix deserti TaxID=2593674 RepID=UPI00131C68AC|nr:aspartate kinase [Saccharothrix deserti]